MCERNILLRHHWNSFFLIIYPSEPILLFEKSKKLKLLTKLYHIRQFLPWYQLCLSRRRNIPWSTSWSAEHGSEFYCFLRTWESPLQLSDGVGAANVADTTADLMCIFIASMLHQWVQGDRQLDKDVFLILNWI